MNLNLNSVIRIGLLFYLLSTIPEPQDHTLIVSQNPKVGEPNLLCQQAHQSEGMTSDIDREEGSLEDMEVYEDDGDGSEMGDAGTFSVPRFLREAFTEELAGEELSPCFMRLPTVLKMKILELLPADDVAKISCVSSELQFLASSDDLWKLKFEEQFGDASRLDENEPWKEKFARVIEFL